jgi:hypothetical protein
VRIVNDVLSQGSGRGLWSLVLLGERKGFYIHLGLCLTGLEMVVHSHGERVLLEYSCAAIDIGSWHFSS